MITTSTPLSHAPTTFARRGIRLAWRIPLLMVLAGLLPYEGSLPGAGLLPGVALVPGASLLAGTGLTRTVSAQALDPAVEAVRTYRESHEVEIIGQFVDLLSIPNVASDSTGIGRNARWIRDALRARGVTSRLLTLPGANPIVFGRVTVPGATQTLAIYVHYDGQPVDPSRWLQDPWVPTLYDGAPAAGGRPVALPGSSDLARALLPGTQPSAQATSPIHSPLNPEWRLMARSAGDDKAPIAAILTALDGLAAHGMAPTTNLVFFFDGEEEAGSPHLEAYLKAYRSLIEDVDLWVFCDGPVHASRQPQIVYGVRGVTGMEITTYGPLRPLHSGHYGNWAPVPGRLLAQLLASMYDERGNVLVAGFYDSTTPIGEREREALRQLPPVDEDLLYELGLSGADGNGESLAERTLLPSLTIRGLESANVGALARNVIPSTATASLGLRLVEGNDPEAMLDLVEAHIRDQGFHVVHEEPTVDVLREHGRVVFVNRRGSGYPAARSSMDLPLARRMAQVVHRAAGQPPLEVPTLGGSLPLYLFTVGLGKPLVILPMANHDNNQHAENENLRLANLWYGIDLMAALLTAD